MKMLQIAVMSIVLMVLTGCFSSSDDFTQAPVQNANQSRMASQATSAQTAGLGDVDDLDFDDMTDDAGENTSTKNVVYFGFDKSNVDPQYMRIIEVNANYLRHHPSAHLRLEGHTDPRGSREYNIGLGERRAQQVADRFKVLGVSSEQLSLVSYGKEKLAIVGDTDEAYQLDRRVKIVYEAS